MDVDGLLCVGGGFEPIYFHGNVGVVVVIECALVWLFNSAKVALLLFVVVLHAALEMAVFLASICVSLGGLHDVVGGFGLRVVVDGEAVGVEGGVVAHVGDDVLDNLDGLVVLLLLAEDVEGA
jgi:hypothetical protein